MIRFGTYKDISSNFDEIWYIMRSVKNLSHNSNAVVRHVPLLSPSVDLFQEYSYLRNSSQWNMMTFQNNYVPKFLKEMQDVGPMQLLDKLYKESKHKDFLLVCACYNEAMCHRSIIAGILQGMYPDIDIQSQDDCNYMSYYYEFMKYKFPVSVNNNTFCLIAEGYIPYSYFAVLEKAISFVLSEKIKQGYNIQVVTGNNKELTRHLYRYTDRYHYSIKDYPTRWVENGKRAWYFHADEVKSFVETYTEYFHADKVKSFVETYPENSRGMIYFWDGQSSKNIVYNLLLAKQCKAPVKIFDFNANRFLTSEEVQREQNNSEALLNSKQFYP